MDPQQQIDPENPGQPLTEEDVYGTPPGPAPGEPDALLAADAAGAPPTPSMDTFGASPVPQMVPGIDVAPVGRMDPFTGQPVEIAPQTLPGALPVANLAAAMPPPAPPSGPPALQALPGGLRREQTIRRDSYKQRTPEQKALDAERATLTEAQKGTAKEEADLHMAEAEAKRDAAEESVVRTKIHELEVQQIMDQGDKQIAEARARHDAAYDAVAHFKFQDYWSDKSTGQKVLAGISLTLGVLGGGLSGTGRNAGAEVIEKAIATDYQKQRDRLKYLGDQEAMARTGIGDAQQAQVAMLKHVDLMEAAATDSAKAKLMSGLARLGMTAEQIAGDQRVQALEAKSIEMRDKLFGEEQHHIETQTLESIAQVAQKRGKGTGTGKGGGKGPRSPWISEVTGKPATDVERHKDAFAERVVDQLKTMEAMPPLSQSDAKTIRDYLAQRIILDKSPGIDYLTKAAGMQNTLEGKLSPEGRASFQAINEWSRAILRGESGGAITNQETLDTFKAYTPTVGDSPANVAKKHEAMRNATRQETRRSFRPSYWDEKLQMTGPAYTAPKAGAAPAAPKGQADDEAMKWARANPKDPRAAAILAANGAR